MPRFLLLLDTPGIKQFVFGTDPLAEIRGASALLDRLNRLDTEDQLAARLQANGARLERVVYANGGSGQLIVEAGTEAPVRRAVAELAGYYRQQTGGEARLLAGLADLSARPYPEALRAAHHSIRERRDLASGSKTTVLMPFLHECESAPHLPVQHLENWAGERLLLSRASHLKRQESHEKGVWSEWMQHLTQTPPWPQPKHWKALRTAEVNEIGAASRRRRGYVGLVYADGNAMGRLVQELDSADTCAAFSRIVDKSIRAACYQTLAAVCAGEVAAVREAAAQDLPLPALPADILLLGGDDLLVLVPADRALPFTIKVTEAFERLTAQRIGELPPGATRDFFTSRLHGRGLTISCGVALARASYPFYLLLDLAEDLLQNAKRIGSQDPRKKESGIPAFWAPAYIDFHLVTGASSHELGRLRSADYFVDTDHRRTLRPYPAEQLAQLGEAVGELRRVGFPPTKLQAMFEAALRTSRQQAEQEVREIFTRCKQSERKPERAALWRAVRMLANGGAFEFPWSRVSAGPWRTPVADLAEAFDLFPEESA